MSASDFPSPIPPALKFDTQNLVTGDSLDPNGVDRFGNPIDATKKYTLAPDPRGELTVAGRRVTAQPFVTKPSSNARPVYSSNGISAKTAGEEEAKGVDYGKDIFTGVPITAKTLGPDEKIVQVSNVQGKNGYTVMSQKQLQRTISNQVVGMGEFGQQDLTGAVNLGIKNPGQTSDNEKPFTDANTGQTVLVKTRSSRTPNTAPLNLPGAGTFSQPTNTAPQGLSPLVSPSTARPPSNQSRPQASPATSTQSTGSPQGRVLGDLIPTGQAKGLRDRNTALNGTTTALENGLRPDPGTGQSYLDLFKPENTQQRQKVANFIRLNDSIAEGEYDRAAGEGSIAGLASFALGIPQAVAASKNNQLQEAFNAIKNDPQAQADVAHYYNQIGQIGGMRKATGASSGQWSFNTLKQEVPNPETDGDLSIVKTKYNNLIREVKNNSGANLKARPFDQNLVQGLNAPAPSAATPNFQVFHDGGQTYRIPASAVNDFKKDHPNAK